MYSMLNYTISKLNIIDILKNNYIYIKMKNCLLVGIVCLILCQIKKFIEQE
jgi:hypothetical protein